MHHIVVAVAAGLAALVPSQAGPVVQTNGASPAPSPAPRGYRLVWADEFERPGLPGPDWSYDTHRNAQGWYNDELQYYAARRPENARVEGGNLVLTARAETLDKTRYPDHGGQRYTSARLLGPAQGWKYGFMEVRAKLPCGRGSWPAIWMLPTKADAQWPLDGEIDVMEHVGYDPGVVHGTIHAKAYNHVEGTQRGRQVKVPDACDAFHRYQLHWTADTIEIGIDDKPYFRFDNDRRGNRTTWPFDTPFRVLLNVAVGGGWGGKEGVDDTRFPQAMTVDYVRVYQPSR